MPRIQSELRLLGFEVAQRTVAKYRIKNPKPPSQTWKTFLEGIGIEQVITAPRSPFQNPFAERVIGSIRRECLDHLIVINESHLRHILSGYFDYYHEARPHQSLDHNSPHPREVEPPSKGQVIAIPQVGGLHHRYRRVA